MPLSRLIARHSNISSTPPSLTARDDYARLTYHATSVVFSTRARANHYLVFDRPAVQLIDDRRDLSAVVRGARFSNISLSLEPSTVTVVTHSAPR